MAGDSSRKRTARATSAGVDERCSGVMRCERANSSADIVVLGLVLGFTMEGEFRRALMMSLGSPSIFLTRPIAAVLIALTLATLLKPALARAWGGLARRSGPAAASVRPD